ncbi:hypothetical protein [Mycobacterium camsae]|uniref:hypothetical protein n=1 Tax=Mycobacterium gordonae TaxID=1778 RepID=UPI001980AF97|nr:hypothetical protein [Mycobacterium gordonae]
MPSADLEFRPQTASGGIPRRFGAAKNWCRTNAQPREARPMTYETLFFESEDAYSAPAFHDGDAE